jgi:hypothetical protein
MVNKINPNSARGIIIPIIEQGDSTEMDTSPDASSNHPTPSSRHGSSSHTSFSPPSGQDDNSQQGFTHPRSGQNSASPMNANNASTPTSTSGQNPPFFPDAENDFATIAAQFMQTSGQTPNFMSTDWNYGSPGTSGNGGTGMTPLSGNEWDFNSISMGWDSMGPSHTSDSNWSGQQVTNRR